MATIKCTGCGANISLDGTKRVVKCAYCGTQYTDDKYVAPKPVYNNPIQQNTILGTPTAANNGRPTVNIGIFCLLFFLLGLVPAVIYLAIINSKQKDWDARNTRR